MKRFNYNNREFRKIIIIILLIIIIYIYFNLLINNTLSSYIVRVIDSKYDYIYHYDKKVLYNSLNKIVSIDTLDYKEAKEVVKVDNKKKEKKVNESKPIIYIYNTHESEKYSLPFVSDYSITPDVKLASFILKDYLNDFGVNSFVQTKSIKTYLNKHNLDYKGSYEASRVYLKEELKNNDYKILIDLHRDSSKHKYTLYKKDKLKYAKIMFVLSTKHKNYKKNEKFVNNINNRINKKYNGLSRGIMKRDDVIFNQDLSSRAILIELGGVDNTLEEVNNTLYVLSEILSNYIKEEL